MNIIIFFKKNFNIEIENQNNKIKNIIKTTNFKLLKDIENKDGFFEVIWPKASIWAAHSLVGTFTGYDSANQKSEKVLLANRDEALGKDPVRSLVCVR